MSLIRFQLLTCGIEVAVDDPEVIAALRYLVQDAVQDIEPQVQVRYEVMGGPDGFRILENGVPVGIEARPHDVMYVIYNRAHEAGYRALPPHAGCATVGGRRVLIVGSKEAGKTTLILQLMHEGIAVHGDELVLITADGLAWPYPRRFHVRPPTFPLIPELAGREGEFPFARLSNGQVVYGVSPTELGQDWRIAPAPVDAVLFLNPNHGGETTAREIAPEAAFRELCGQSRFPERSVEWFSLMFGLVKQARNLVLINGGLREASATVRDICNY
jgi:hypothetical protein